MKRYFQSVTLLLAGFVLLTIGLRQYCSTEYCAGTTAISGSLEYLEKEKMRYAIRYNRGLKNDSLNYRVPGITSKAFDFVNLGRISVRTIFFLILLVCLYDFFRIYVK